MSLALNDVSPGHQNLGSLNSIGLTFNSGIRAVTPALFSSLYAYGVTHQILGGQFGIVIIAMFAGGFWVACQFLPKPVDDEPKNMKKDVEQQDEAPANREGEPIAKTNGHDENSEAQPLLSHGNMPAEVDTPEPEGIRE